MKRADKLDISTLTLLKLWFLTLFYHSSLDLGYFLETLVTPCFWLVDHTTGLIGKIFVILVVFLVSSIGTIAHLIGIPVYASSSPIYLYGFLVPLGYWILINIGFNFTLACRTDPGRPVDPKQLSKRTESNTICKKCIQPKPPRTHHCSICNTCYLTMDHHCPWINNCVGHFNHRYFYLTMVYITVGCLYMMIFGLDIAYRQLYLDEDVLPFEIEIINTSNAQSSLPVLPVNPDSDTQDNQGTKNLQEYIDENAWLQFALRIFGFGKVSKSRDNIDNYGEYTRLLFGIVVSRQFYTGMIYMAALLCVGACLALGGLSIWHAQLIGRGETSIEYHINKAGRRKLGDKYENPYDCGKLRNWAIFLGLDQPGKSFWKHILFPSAHCPTGNGYEWSYLSPGLHDIRDNYYKEC